MLPVIHATPAQVTIVKRESQRLDEVEPGTGEGAKAPDVARILGYLGLEKDDLQWLSHVHK